MSKPIDTDFRDAPMCPGCGMDHDALMAVADDSGTHVCMCGVKFGWERVQTVTYCTKAVQ